MSHCPLTHSLTHSLTQGLVVEAKADRLKGFETVKAVHLDPTYVLVDLNLNYSVNVPV